MEMLPSDQITAAQLTGWTKLAQGLHARYRIDDFAAGVRFLAAVGEAGDEVSHPPRGSMGPGYVDLKLLTDDAIYRTDDGTEYVVAWPTRTDVDLARRITGIAREQGLVAEPEAVTGVELGLQVDASSAVAPFWAALLVGDPAARGWGSPSDEVRDRTEQTPNLWFDDAGAESKGAQRFTVEVYVAAAEAERRIAAALAAGGTLVDDSDGPGLRVLADPEGNRGVICVA